MLVGSSPPSASTLSRSAAARSPLAPAAACPSSTGPPASRRPSLGRDGRRSLLRSPRTPCSSTRLPSPRPGGRALFPVVRDPTRRGEFGILPDGRQVLFDDNTTPTDAFLWAAERTKGPDVQFNHVWSAPADPDAYTALWNLCCTPAFLAKASDTHRSTVAALRYRSWELYGHVPTGQPNPLRPEGYDIIRWAPAPAAVTNLEAVLRERMRAAPNHRATLVARRLGWAYSNGPDATLRP